jgi:tetratricopeptide (TPR) repeat protein
MWNAANHYYWHGLAKLYQGHFDAAKLMLTKLTEIADTYENDIYRLLQHLLKIYLLIECHHINEANAELNRGIDFVQRRGWGSSIFHMYSLKARVHLLMKETEEAEKSLDQANRIRSEVTANPIQLSAFYRSQSEYYLRRLEDYLKAGQSKESSEYRRSAFKSGKMLIKTCRKAASYRTDSYRLMGVYEWLIHDQKTALKWWHKAITEGERLGARAQLSWLYLDIGKRLLGSKGKYTMLGGLAGEEYLHKASALFEEMKLPEMERSTNELPEMPV